MESESVGKYEEALIAEREAILRQLALLGSDSEDEEKDENEEQSEEPQNVKTEPCEIEPTTCSESVEDLNAVGPPDEKKVLDSCPQETDSFGLDEDNEVDVDEEEKPCSAEPPSTGTSSENSRSPPVPVEKVVLDRGPADRIDLDKNHPLPDGWTVITHFSGMPVYYHRFTRVVTHSRPYQVEGIVRDHDIPLPSIPCLYRQIMDEKQKNLENQSEMTEEEIQENLQLHESEKTMSPERYRLYCEGRFKFKKITVHRYTNPEEKLGAVQKKRLNSMLKKKGFELDYDQLKKNNTPGEVLLSSQSGACLIDLTPAQAKLGTKKGGPRKPYLLNPMGKTTVAVLNEFVQRLAKGTLVYEVEDTRNVSNPYQATAMLTMRISTLRELVGQCKESLLVLSEKADLTGNSQAALDPEFKRFSIGCGVGANKKTARLVAAKDALTKIIPKLRISKEHVCDGVLEERLQKGFEEEAAELFKQVKIDSSSVVSMCTRFAIPKPFNLLRDAVSRAVRWNGMELKTKKEMVGNGSQLSKVVLELGDMEAGAEAIGVKQATQLAAQLLLQKMHPELPTYGSFLTLYGRFEDKKQLDNARRQHEEVVRLQDTGNLLQPNTNVLDKLANEMRNISLIYPPRRYLYGLEPQSSGIKTKTETATTQTDIIDYQFMIQPHMVPVQPPYGLPIPPLLQPSMSSPAFVGAPPQDYYYYQQPFQNQRNPRKRGHPTTPPYPHPGPPPPPNV